MVCCGRAARVQVEKAHAIKAAQNTAHSGGFIAAIAEVQSGSTLCFSTDSLYLFFHLTSSLNWILIRFNKFK